MFSNKGILCNPVLKPFISAIVEFESLTSVGKITIIFADWPDKLFTGDRKT